MNEIILKNVILTMTSREIAELTGSTHDNVLKTVRSLVARGVISGNETPYVHPQNGQTYTEFSLTYRDTMVVVSGYSVELRAKIIDRWQELEAKQQPDISTAEGQLLVLQGLVSKQLELLQQNKLIAVQRDEAIRTKAEIGERREATAMNTASQAVKKANALEQQLDLAKNYASIKRMQMLYHGTKFDWRVLKATGIDMGIETISVFDQNYGTVRAYHADVWREAYAVSIDG